jgi:UDP:flavonoid glycosyltransferase YjiC (YdhE family)
MAPTTVHEAGHRGARIVLTSHGSAGDLYPYVAIALGLRARGHDAIVATGECHRAMVEAMGIGFRPVRPNNDWVTDPGIMRRIMHPRWGLARVIREIWLPILRETYEDLLAATDGSDLLVAMQANYASRLVAEKKGVRWASAMHLPIGFLSAYDPPPLPVFPSLTRPLRLLGPAFCKPVIGLIKWATRGWADPLRRLRDEIGLPPDNTFNPLSDGHAPLLHLALYSKLLADKQPDWPPQAIVTGFPWPDQSTEGMPDGLSHFLDDGRPPIVFTLGTTIAEHAVAPAFFEHSAAAAKLLCRRAVLILKSSRNRPPVLPEGVMAFNYAPFSKLFPRAAAIVHQGGIGTTALAMRSGRPMLIMPSAHDQPDNAERAARLGISRTIHRRRYTAQRVAAELRQILEHPVYSCRAAEVGEKVRQEDGVRCACDAIEALLRTGRFAQAPVN